MAKTPLTRPRFRVSAGRISGAFALAGLCVIPSLSWGAESEAEQKPSESETPTAAESKEEPPEDPKERAEIPIEVDDSWENQPFDTHDGHWNEDFPHNRWAGVGAFVGSVYRPSGSESIRYKAGVAYGGYLRPEITSWLAARLYYRQESIPVVVEQGGFDYGGASYNLDFEQPNIQVVSVGIHLEPVWTIHPRFRLRGIAGWAWMGFRAEMPEAPGYNEPIDGARGIGGARQGVEVDIYFGGGVTFDIIENWLDLSVDATYGFTASQTGSAYEPQQIVVNGQVSHIAPLPEFGNPSDVIFSLGLIL